MNDKIKLFVIIIFTALLIFGVAMWAWPLWQAGDYIWASLIWVIALTVAVAAFIIFKRLVVSVYKKGWPLKDERSKKLEVYAGAWAFFIGIYWLLFLAYAVENFSWGASFLPRHVAEAGIIGQALIFGLAYWYLSKWGKV